MAKVLPAKPGYLGAGNFASRFGMPVQLLTSPVVSLFGNWLIPTRQAMFA